MGQNNPGQNSGNKLRHYLIMTTLVVTGIIILLLINNQSNSNNLTSAVIENVRNSSLIDSLTNLGEESQPSIDFPSKTEKFGSNSNTMEFLLLSSVIPGINQNIRAESLQVTFDDLSTPITVNGDQLELAGLNQVALGIYGFAGQVAFDERELTLDGTAKRFEVNGISLASSSQLKISFQGLDYQQIKMTQAQLKDLDFVTGDGSISIGSRLTYVLENGQVATIHGFSGNIDVSKSQLAVDLNSTIEEASLRLEGVARGLDALNGAVNINLR